MGRQSLVNTIRLAIASRLFYLAGRAHDIYDVWLDDAPSQRAPRVPVNADNVAMRLHNTTDAQMWTEQFLAIYPEGTADHETLVGWFANAIEVGRTFGQRDAA